MMHSHRGFRAALGALAFLALVVGASPAALAAAGGRRPPAAPAPSLWQLVGGGIEAGWAEVLRLAGWGEPGHGGARRGQALPGGGATISGGSPASAGASSDQSGTINPNGG